MRNIWNRLYHKFVQPQHPKTEPPFIHESIKDTLVDLQIVEKWQQTPYNRGLSRDVLTAYASFCNPDQKDPYSIQFIDRSGIFGCVIHCEDYEELEHPDFLCIMEDLRQRVDALPYIKNLGDIKSQYKSGNIEKTYRYYLKPSMRLVEDGKNHQLYGNITITYRVVNNTSRHLKITANTYNDHKYHDPMPHDELMQLLFKV